MAEKMLEAEQQLALTFTQPNNPAGKPFAEDFVARGSIDH
jgi:hypothetical protein